MCKIIRVITRLNIGGPAQHAILLTSLLNDDRFRSQLVTGVESLGEGNILELARAKGIRWITLPTLRNTAGVIDDLRTFMRLWELFRRERPTIVHTHMFKARVLGGLAAWLARVPVKVETFHGTLFSGYHHPVVTRVLVVLEQLLARRMDAVVAVSEEVAREIRQLHVARSEQVHVIPLGLELDRFVHGASAPGMLRQDLGVSREAPLVGIVGRLVPIKGLRYFLDAVSEVLRVVPDAVVVIVGDGPDRVALEERVRRQGLEQQVRFLGWRKDVERIFADLDLVVLSSLSEGTPVTLIEAMAAGKPVVATRVGGVPDLIRDGETGVLVPPRDAAALAQAMIALLHDAERRHRLGAAARRSVYPEYEVARLVDRTRRLYDQVLRRRGLATQGANA